MAPCCLHPGPQNSSLLVASMRRSPQTLQSPRTPGQSSLVSPAPTGGLCLLLPVCPSIPHNPLGPPSRCSYSSFMSEWKQPFLSLDQDRALAVCSHSSLGLPDTTLGTRHYSLFPASHPTADTACLPSVSQALTTHQLNG